MSAREVASPPPAPPAGDQPGPAQQLQQPEPLLPAEPSHGPSREPQPWQSDEDVRGWRRVGRANTSGQPIGVSVLVDLDTEQAAWLAREATQADLTLAGLVKQLIDEARQRAK